MNLKHLIRHDIFHIINSNREQKILKEKKRGKWKKANSVYIIA